MRQQPAHTNYLGSLNRRKNKGFTLTELMMTVGLFGVIMLFAVPIAGSMSSRFQTKSGLGLLSASVKLAFTSANYINQDVTICASSDGANCSATKNWKEGWIVFYDDSGPIIIHRSEPSQSIDLIANGFADNGRIDIRPTRRAIESSAVYGVIAACTPSNGEAVTGLIISNHGLLRLALDTDGDGDLEDQDDNTVSCT